MIALRDSFVIPRVRVASVFAFVSDLANLPEWDSAVQAVEQLTEGPVRAGTRYRIRASVFGRELAVSCRIAELDPPARFVCVVESPSLSKVDRFSFQSLDGGRGTEVQYVTDIVLAGYLRLAEPFLRRPLQRLRGRAAGRLEKALLRRRPRHPARLGYFERAW